MKKLSFGILLCFFMIGFSRSSKAQYVTIPDSNFLKVLVSLFPSAISGIQMDTTNVSIVNATSLSCQSKFIHSIEGIQYFDNLQTLKCDDNLIRSISKFPPNLISFSAEINLLDSLPPLPLSLQSLIVSRNNLKTLPSIPSALTSLRCDLNYLTVLPSLNNLQQISVKRNYITALPILPASLSMLDCSLNKIDSIPTLPLSLNSLNTAFNPIHTLPILPTSLSSLSCDGDSLSDLPILPASLKKLYCSNNQIDTLPILPSSLQELNCGSNLLSFLPTQPNSLLELFCHNNSITSLPILSTSLQILNCDNNLLTTLPILPNTLQNLSCASNSIPSLPSLPTSLIILDYSENPITTLPTLPSNLAELYWNYNTTNILPTLPASLYKLYCNHSTIDSLPSLPNNLNTLQCQYDALTFLPTLPPLLKYLDFGFNLMSNFPSLPNGLFEIQCQNNLITTIPYLPSSVKNINCSHNTGLTCLPKISSAMSWVYFDSTAINCLPNFFVVTDTTRSSNSLFTMSLCTPASGCPCAWNITGNVHNDTSATCLLDSLNPGNNIHNVNMLLYKNSTLVDQIYLTALGEYSFDTNDHDTLDVTFDTFDLPFGIVCPIGGTQHLILTPTDSLKTNINFGVECNGVDAGVGAIEGRFRPGQTTRLNIQAGSMSKFYGVECPTSYSATVTTLLEGPITYVMPSALALTPNSVVGNLLTYLIPDMSTIDVKTAFNIEVYTDSGAQIGSSVCITTAVSNVLSDTKLGNNEKKICMNVVNSLDPNAKYVSPSENAAPGDKLTYTIYFQNTGNDTAYRVIVRDTLSNNLDMSTFKFVASSHPASIEIKDHKVAFYFHKINLLDSLHHEPESHGWLQFTIQLKNNLPIGTKTNNVAAIYFDFNDPIYTDTATNYIGPDLTYAAPTDPIKLPNAITPNFDGLNDYWHVLNTSFLIEKKLNIEKVMIVNRWGNIVFSGSGNSFRWQPPTTESSDVYMYQILYSTLSGNTHIQRGEITVLR